VIGFIAGVAVLRRDPAARAPKVDDALDVWAVHGVGGTLGVLLTGVLATTA